MYGIHVLKFGGAACATPEHFSSIADIICRKKEAERRLIVVVSAMMGATDDLIRLAYRVNDNPPKRELDMLIAVGERVSASLLSMALCKRGIDAVSFTGSQAGIITSPHHNEAKIVDVRPTRLHAPLQENKVVIVAGFQGVSVTGEITTLGRGGSDTTAVALGCAFNCPAVTFYKDVRGIYPAAPAPGSQTDPLFELHYDEALRIVQDSGARVLHTRAIELAKSNALALQVLSFKDYFRHNRGTWIRDEKRMKPQHAIFEHWQ